MEPAETVHIEIPQLRFGSQLYTSEVWKDLGAEWHGLVELGAEVPAFLGRSWVGAWLDVYGGALRPMIWTCRSGSSLNAACLLTPRRERRGPIPVHCLYLNTAGEDAGEGVCAEYNQVLCLQGSEDAAARALGVEVHTSGADEIVATGMTSSGVEFLRRALPGWPEEIRWSEDPYVDLAHLRAGGLDYRKSALSRNSRTQVNQTLRAYTGIGDVRVEVAQTTERALTMLDELIDLHQASWLGRKHPGAFASERMRRFHRQFVSTGLDGGLVHLVRVTAGSETIGILYNLVDRERIFFYQSGLRYREGNQYRPGIAAHACAIDRYMEAGVNEYHFLAGDSETPRYKKTLATHARDLAWVHFQRPGLKSASIRRLRALKRRLAGRDE